MPRLLHESVIRLRDASLLAGKKDLIEPEIDVSQQGTIHVSDTPGLGYHVRRELIKRLAHEKETWRSR